MLHHVLRWYHQQWASHGVGQPAHGWHRDVRRRNVCQCCIISRAGTAAGQELAREPTQYIISSIQYRGRAAPRTGVLCIYIGRALYMYHPRGGTRHIYGVLVHARAPERARVRATSARTACGIPPTGGYTVPPLGVPMAHIYVPCRIYMVYCMVQGQDHGRHPLLVYCCCCCCTAQFMLRWYHQQWSSHGVGQPAHGWHRDVRRRNVCQCCSISIIISSSTGW